MVRIEHLMYLQEIVKKKSFSNAAESLYISQQSLSEAVAKLEKQFQFKIFIRSRKGIQLTVRGAALMEDVDELVRQYRRILEKHGPKQRAPRSHLVVCVNPLVAGNRTAQSIKRFGQRFSDVELMVVEERTPRKVLEQVIAGRAQIGITSMPGALYKHEEIMKMVRLEELYLDYLCLLARVDHPLAKRKSILLRECIDEPLVLDGDGRIQEDLLDDCCVQQGISKPLHVVMQTTSDAYLRLVQEGAAVGFITKAQFNMLDLSELVAIPLKDVDPLHFVMAIPLSVDEPQVIQDFMSIYIESMASEE